MSLWRRAYQQTCAHVRKGVWLLGFIAYEAPSQRVETAFHSECMTLQCRFTPAIIALLIANFDEEPAWKDTEVFDGLDLGHFGSWEGEEEETRGNRREESREVGRIREKKYVIACNGYAR